MLEQVMGLNGHASQGYDLLDDLEMCGAFLIIIVLNHCLKCRLIVI